MLTSYERLALKLVCFFQPHPEAFWNIIDWLSLSCAFAVLATYIRMEVEVAQSKFHVFFSKSGLSYISPPRLDQLQR